jgi:DNA-binding transcriptional LysR family regulator
LPPLEQIEAFVAAARGPTFRAAAETCALSPAAFSRRVQAFSAFVGLTLFERCSTGLRLTDAGRRCLADLEPAFLELRRVAAAVSREDDDELVVALSASHSLTVGWIIPRLARFRETHPQIELCLRTRRDAADLRSGDADLGLCFSDVDLAGLAHTPLLDVEVTPVAAPAMAAAVHHRGNLRGQRLLTAASPPGVWAWWGKASGCGDDLASSASFDILQASYEAAAEGGGVALGASPTVWPYLESGRLVRLGWPAVRLPGGAYHLAARPERKRRRAVASVWRWLEDEARQAPSLMTMVGSPCAGRPDRP